MQRGAGRTSNLWRQLGGIKGALAHVGRRPDVDLARVGVSNRSSRRGRHLADYSPRCGRYEDAVVQPDTRWVRRDWSDWSRRGGET